MQLLFTALKFMKFDKPKSIGALFGVIISIFLIGQQTGIFTFLTNAMSYLVRVNDGYVWVTDNKTTNVNALAPIDVTDAGIVTVENVDIPVSTLPQL